MVSKEIAFANKRLVQNNAYNKPYIIEFTNEKPLNWSLSCIDSTYIIFFLLFFQMDAFFKGTISGKA